MPAQQFIERIKILTSLVPTTHTVVSRLLHQIVKKVNKANAVLFGKSLLVGHSCFILSTF
jgi:5,10-methylene-tetrahydrofolate dehydrogenase/methenyl tetrahydrofolate cyclohydrolase